MEENCEKNVTLMLTKKDEAFSKKFVAITGINKFNIELV